MWPSTIGLKLLISISNCESDPATCRYRSLHCESYDICNHCKDQFSDINSVRIKDRVSQGHDGASTILSSPFCLFSRLHILFTERLKKTLTEIMRWVEQTVSVNFQLTALRSIFDGKYTYITFGPTNERTDKGMTSISHVESVKN